MRSEQDGHRRSNLSGEFGEGRAEPLSERVGKKWMLRPAFSEVDTQSACLCLHGAAVEADASTRVLRGHADDGGFFHAVFAHQANNVGDVRTPVAHADVNAHLLTCGGKF